MLNKFKSKSKKSLITLWFYCALVGNFFKVTDMVIRHLFSGHHGIEIEIANGFFYCVSRKWQSAVFATKNLLLKHWHFGPPTTIYFVAVEKWPKLLCHLYLLVNGFLIGHMSLDGFFGEISTPKLLSKWSMNLVKVENSQSIFWCLPCTKIIEQHYCLSASLRITTGTLSRFNFRWKS